MTEQNEIFYDFRLQCQGALSSARKEQSSISRQEICPVLKYQAKGGKKIRLGSMPHGAGSLRRWKRRSGGDGDSEQRKGALRNGGTLLPCQNIGLLEAS